MITFIVTLLVSALIILLAAWLLPGVSVKSYGWAIVVALVVGLLNALFGMFLPDFGFLVSLIVDAVAIWCAGKLLKSFSVANFWWALGCAAVIAVCQWLLGSVVAL
ncbi:MAG: phage holin family protein [Paludibacteraceae bacterium]|nr:phage holin family protein [Paludibacteraceae bacterium]